MRAIKPKFSAIAKWIDSHCHDNALILSPLERESLIRWFASVLLLAAIILAGCTVPTPVVEASKVKELSESLTYFSDQKTGLCFAAVASDTSESYRVVSIAHVPCERVALSPETNTGPMHSLDFTMIDGICSHASKPGAYWPAYRDGADLVCREIDRPKEKRK